MGVSVVIPPDREYQGPEGYSWHQVSGEPEVWVLTGEGGPIASLIRWGPGWRTITPGRGMVLRPEDFSDSYGTLSSLALPGTEFDRALTHAESQACLVSAREAQNALVRAMHREGDRGR